MPDGDILIHAGDATWRGTVEEVEEFLQWFSAFPHKHKIFVAGNHDRGFEDARKQILLNRFPANITYLEDSGCEINGLKFWGTPYQPFFCNWAFNIVEEAERAKHYKLIPDDIDVLITHTPPFGILDKVQDVYKCGSRTGCKVLRKEVTRVQPIVHIFGHIHGSYGIKHTENTVFINASLCDEDYEMLNKPIIFSVDK